MCMCNCIQYVYIYMPMSLYPSPCGCGGVWVAWVGGNPPNTTWSEGGQEHGTRDHTIYIYMYIHIYIRVRICIHTWHISLSKLRHALTFSVGPWLGHRFNLWAMLCFFTLVVTARLHVRNCPVIEPAVTLTMTLLMVLVTGTRGI
jgi:hypothetical protein